MSDDTVKPSAKREKPITLPPAGISPNRFAIAMREHLAERYVAALPAGTRDGQPVGKTYLRPYLRSRYGATHEPRTEWHLTETQMLDLLTRFGNDRARAYATNRLKRTK